jgi:hypothetical protein
LISIVGKPDLLIACEQMGFTHAPATSDRSTRQTCQAYPAYPALLDFQ